MLYSTEAIQLFAPNCSVLFSTVLVTLVQGKG